MIKGQKTKRDGEDRDWKFSLINRIEEEGIEATDGDKAVGRDDVFEIRLVGEFFTQFR